MKPTIGIIGGCGPLATIDIEGKILKATQRIVHPLVDQDYFNLLVFNRTQFYDRNDAIISDQATLFDEYLNCAKSLISIGIDILLVACQTAHVYLPELQSNIDVPIVDIVHETARYTSKILPNISKVGLLSTDATQRKRLYQDTLISYDIEVITIPTDMQKKLMEAIYIIKTGVNLTNEGKELLNDRYFMIKKDKYSEFKNHSYRKILLERFFPNPIAIIKEAISYLISCGCNHVILGCTELPLLLPHINMKKIDINLIDPNTIVAESVVYLVNKLEQERLECVI